MTTVYCGSAFASYRAYLTSGIKQYNQGKYSDAIRSFRAAIQASGSSDTAHYYLANCLMKQGKKNKALLEYKRAYMLASSETMNRNCAAVLKKYNIKLPKRLKEARSIRSARANMSPYTVANANDISNLIGKSKSVKLQDSHTGGPQKFTAAPEGGSLKGSWDRWIQNFRITFNNTMYRKIGGGKWALWGNSKMVFSVDKNGKLRGRIISSSAPYFWDHYLLETTRSMDRHSVLSFPRGSSIPGFNFTMGWNNGPTKKNVSRQTQIVLKNIQAKLRKNPITGESAVASRIKFRKVRASLSNRNVSARLKTNKVSGKLTSQKSGSLPLPEFKTKVSATILPKPKSKELKAVQHKIKSPPVKKPVKK